MKKFLISLVIAFGMVLPSKASQVNLSNRISGIESYSDSINYNSLGNIQKISKLFGCEWKN